MASVELVMILTTGLFPRSPSSVGQNFEQRDLSGTLEDNRRLLLSSRGDINIRTTERYETRDSRNLKDGNFPALILSFDRQTHTLHAVTANYASQSNNPEFMTGRFSAQKRPLSKHSDQSQIIAAAHIHFVCSRRLSIVFGKKAVANLVSSVSIYENSKLILMMLNSVSLYFN